jgi:hypothetical protein
MPVQISYPYFELEFDANGQPKDPRQIQALLDGLKANNTTDVWVISHGWNNDEKDAHLLYQTLFTNVKAQEKSVNVDGRSFAVAGVIWPSKRFDAADDKPNAASLGNGASRISAQIDTLAAFLADGPNAAKDKEDLDRAKTLIPKLETDAAARKEFNTIVLARLPSTVGEEGGWYINSKVGSDMTADDTLLKQLGSPPPKVVSTGGGGATSMGMGHKPAAPTGPTFQGAAGIGDFFKGVFAGASNLLNYVTYYQMKDRAGVVGRTGVNQVVQKIRTALPNVRVHLVGHSFGCRVVTAAATGPATSPKGFVNSLTLLQGAFSHYAFSQKFDDSGKPGFYRNLIDESRVSGPTIITHTRADDAVGIAYAVASRAMHQIASAMGDKNDPYGGLGSNGAQKTTEARDATMPKAGVPFDQPLAKGSMTNLLADGLITSHGDVTNPNAAYSVLSAAAAAV